MGAAMLHILILLIRHLQHTHTSARYIRVVVVWKKGDGRLTPVVVWGAMTHAL
jgi:hypothetical protein